MSTCCVYYCKWNKGETDSHALLMRALSCHLGRDMDFPVKKAVHGKPYIEELPDVHFSISHAGEYWACAIGDAEIGLDLQDVRSGRNVMAIAGRFFHPDETAWLKAHDADEFYRIWTHKESYVKYTGEGLTKGLDHFSVADGLSENPMVLSLPGLPAVVQQEIDFIDGYQLVLTSRERDEISISIFSPHPFTKQAK